MAETGAGIEGLLADCALARMVAQALRQETFGLLDIGCAGGSAPGMAHLRRALRGAGRGRHDR